MKRTIVILLLSCLGLSLTAQTTNFFPTKKGVVCIYKFKDAKGKPEIVSQTKAEMFVRQTVTDVKQNGGATVISLSLEGNFLDQMEASDVKSKLEEDLKNMNVRIENNTLYSENFLARTTSLISSEFNKLASGDTKMEMNTEVKQSQLPLNLSVGQTLPDEEVMKMTMKITGGPMNLTTNTIYTSKNRKVEAKEDVVTPAGTFSCFKISYIYAASMEMPMMKQSENLKIIDWYSPELGLVKTEQYDKKGKLSSTMILSEIQNL